MNRTILFGIVSLVLTMGVVKAQLGDSGSYLNQLDLDFSQYNERMGISLWSFNQNMAVARMGDARDIVARGQERIRSHKATVTYHSVAPTVAHIFAQSRTQDGAKRREIVQTYNQYLGRFREAQRNEKLGERDVAASLGLAFASQYEIYSNGQVANPAQERDIVAQFRRSLLKNAYFQGTNDRYRQLLDETTAVEAVAALVVYRNAVKKGDRSTVESERQRALRFLDFYWPGGEERAKKIRLTESGFRE